MVSLDAVDWVVVLGRAAIPDASFLLDVRFLRSLLGSVLILLFLVEGAGLLGTDAKVSCLGQHMSTIHGAAGCFHDIDSALNAMLGTLPIQTWVNSVMYV